MDGITAARRWQGRLPGAAGIVAFILGIVLILLLVFGPLYTNDGPLHVQFAWAIAHPDDASRPLQALIYERHVRFEPNLLPYFPMALLIRLTGAAIAESVIQWLCLALPLAGAAFTLRSLESDRRWLLFPMLALLIAQPLFLGLYNSCLSCAGFFFATGLAVRAVRSPGRRTAALIVLCLAITFLTHASGFIEAVAACVTIFGTDIAMRRGARMAAIRRLSLPLLATVAGAALQLVPMIAHPGAPVEYGSTTVLVRIQYLLSLRTLAAAGVSPKATMLFSAALIGMAVAGIVARRRSGARIGFRQAAMLALVATTLLIALAIPDMAGGGWTHARRAAVYPFLSLLLFTATLPLPAKLPVRVLGLTASIVMLLWQTGAIIVDHARLAKRAGMYRQLADRVGPHCTVLAIPLIPAANYWSRPDLMGRFKLDRLSHQFTRIEAADDRVSLYNWLARLDVYPLRYRPGMDPHGTTFGWSHYHQQPGAYPRIDMPAYERESGITIDYVVVEDPFAVRSPVSENLRRQVAAGYRRIATADDGRMAMYERVVHHPLCRPARR